jgi:hypothetical protein
VQKKGFYFDVRKLTSGSWKADFARQPHAAVMKALKGLDAKSLSSNCAAHIAGYLEDSIYCRSATHQTWRWKNGDFFVRQGLYKDETRLLKLLCTRLQYTDAIKGWLTEHMHGFAEHVRQDRKLSDRIRQWPSLSLRQRKNLTQNS